MPMWSGSHTVTPDRGASPADQSRHTLSGKDHHQYPALNGVADSLLGLPFRCLPSPGCYSRASPPLNVRCLTFLFPSFLHRMPLKCPDQAPTSKRQRTTKIEVPEDGVDHACWAIQRVRSWPSGIVRESVEGRALRRRL